MAALKLIKIHDRKTTYPIKVMNSNGDTKNEWMDRDAITFIDPQFLDRLEAGSSAPSIQNTHKESPVVVHEKKLNCEECGRAFKRLDHLKEHIRKLHSMDREEYRCPLCTS